MSTDRLDLYINNIDGKHAENLAYIALSNVKKAGYKTPIELVTAAYESYNRSITQSALHLLETCGTCSYFLKKYHIRYREDIYYVLRHSEDYKGEADELQCKKRMVLNFNSKKIGSEQEELKQMEVYNHLSPMFPAERAEEVEKVLFQFLITSHNEYFFDQSATRLYNYLLEAAVFDDYGRAQASVDNAVSLIWNVGRAEEKNTSDVK